MSKRNRDAESREPRETETEPTGGPILPAGVIRILTLAGVGVLIFMNARIWSQTGRFEQTVVQIDSRVAQLAQKVDAIAARPAPQRQPTGPDPNRVYAIKTAGSPVEGPENAPVTIAEFSDFQ